MDENEESSCERGGLRVSSKEVTGFRGKRKRWQGSGIGRM